MFFCLNKVYPRETAQCSRRVIPGQDQGPYLHELHNADEATCNHHHKVLGLVKKDRKESNATSFPCVIIKNAPPTIVDFVH